MLCGGDSQMCRHRDVAGVRQASYTWWLRIQQKPSDISLFPTGMVWEEISVALRTWVFLIQSWSFLWSSPPCVQEDPLHSFCGSLIYLFIEWKIKPPFLTPQIFHLTLLSMLCSVPLTSGFATHHKRTWGVLTAGLIYFWNWRDDKGLVVQMCFVGSVYRAQGLWQEQLTLPFNNLGKSLWEECSGKLFPCCSQRENRIHKLIEP